MAKQTVDIGEVANDKTGDPIREAMRKINENFDELYSDAIIGSSLTIGNSISSANVLVTPGLINVGSNASNKTVINTTAVVTNVVTATQIYGHVDNPVIITTVDDNHIIFRTYGDDETANKLIICANGNIGIGNNNPEDRLRIEGPFGVNSISIGNSYINSHISFVNGRNIFFFTGVANSTDYVGTTPKALVVNSQTLYANLVNYVRVDGLADNVVKLRANVATYIDANDGLVSNSSGVFIEANVESGLIANSSGLHIDSNNFNVNSAIRIRANNGLISNSFGTFVSAQTGLYTNSRGLYVNSEYIETLTSANTRFVYQTAAEYVVNNAQLQANLNNYVSITSLPGRVATLTSNNATFAYGKTEGTLGVNTSVYVNGPGFVNTRSVNALSGTFNDVYANQMYLDAGFGSKAPIYGVRAWGTFDGRPGVVRWWWWWWWWPIVIERGRGDYELIFNTPMPDINYAVIASADIDRVRWPWWYYPWPGFVDVYERTTTSVKLRVVGNWWNYYLFYYDSPRVSVAVIR